LPHKIQTQCVCTGAWAILVVKALRY